MKVKNGDSLGGAAVLVTRPRYQQNRFCTLVQRQGGTAISFPCLDIIGNGTDINEYQDDLAQCDAIIFTSTNAVNYANRARKLPWKPGTTEILAIGPGTADRLFELGQPVTHRPVPPYNTEALLTLSPFVQKNLQKLAIIKGSGGRELLAKEIQEAGISLISIEVYDRARPIYTTAEIDAVFLNSSADIVTITSNESLLNLVELAGDHFRGQLRQLPLVVNSARGAKLAKKLGFESHVLVAQVPGDQGQLDAIKLWNQSYRFKL